MVNGTAALGATNEDSRLDSAAFYSISHWSPNAIYSMFHEKQNLVSQNIDFHVTVAQENQLERQ